MTKHRTREWYLRGIRNLDFEGEQPTQNDVRAVESDAFRKMLHYHFDGVNEAIAEAGFLHPVQHLEEILICLAWDEPYYFKTSDLGKGRPETPPGHTPPKNSDVTFLTAKQLGMHLRMLDEADTCLSVEPWGRSGSGTTWCATVERTRRNS